MTFIPLLGAFILRVIYILTARQDFIDAFPRGNLYELGDAYLAHSMSGSGANHYVYTMLSVYGKTAAEVDTIRAKWQPWLEQLLGVEAPSPTAS